MSDRKLPRLLAAAKEFNIGAETLIDFLAGKGFSRDELKPTAKLTEDMYTALQHEFQSDKLARNKANQIEIPKATGAQQQPPVEKKKKEETEVEVIPEATPQPEIVQQEVVEEAIEEVAPVVEEKPIIDLPEEKIEEQTQSDEEDPVKITEEEKIIKTEKTTIEGPKVINKIDLSEIDSSTRPKKAKEKKEQKPVVEEKTEVKKETEKKKKKFKIYKKPQSRK